MLQPNSYPRFAKQKQDYVALVVLNKQKNALQYNLTFCGTKL
jgi:hypothetical protein